MKTYNQFTEFLTEQVQWQRSLFDHLFYDADLLMTSDMYGKETKSYDEDDEDDIKSEGFKKERNQYVFQKHTNRSFQLPLNSRFIERVSGEIQLLACHSTGSQGLKDLVKIQKKRTKQISAYTVDPYGDMTSGIWSDNNGGIIAVVKGQAVAGLQKDLWSKVDKQGKRLLDITTNGGLRPATVFRSGIRNWNKESNAKFMSLIKSYENMTQELVDMKRDMIKVLEKEYGNKRVAPKNKGEQRWETLRPYDIPGSVKQQYIRKYVVGAERIITSKPEWQKAFTEYILSWPKVQAKRMRMKTKQDTYDEIVVGNFEIVYAFIATSALNKGEDVEAYRKQFNFPTKVLRYATLDASKSVLKDYLKEIQKKEG